MQIHRRSVASGGWVWRVAADRFGRAAVAPGSAIGSTVVLEVTEVRGHGIAVAGGLFWYAPAPIFDIVATLHPQGVHHAQ